MEADPMTSDEPEEQSIGRWRHRRHIDDQFPDPSASMVLHRVLAMSARTFLLNDMDGEFEDRPRPPGAIDALSLSMGTRPLWAQSTAVALQGTGRRHDPIERVHQSRVAMRRIRANLRSFRLLLDPSWGTSLRAELGWYGNVLGRTRDLDLLAEVIGARGPEVLDPGEVARLLAVVDWRRGEVASSIATERTGLRRLQLTEQMMLLWDGPEFKASASEPATDILPAMLHRAWRDLRGVARQARKDPSDVHLHKLRIRLKDLRYGAETVALVEGAPARKTAKAAEQLQGKLGDLHDVVFSIAWLQALAAEQPDLADASERLCVLQRDAASDVRDGWRRELKDVERRWRAWQS